LAEVNPEPLMLSKPQLRLFDIGGNLGGVVSDAYLDACLEPDYGRIVIQEASAVLRPVYRQDSQIGRKLIQG
jgi:hypothetical protein